MLECKRATRQEGAYTPEARVNVGYHSEHIGIQLDECTGVHQSDRMHDTKITWLVSWDLDQASFKAER